MSYYFDLAIEAYGCPAITVINGEEIIDKTKKSLISLFICPQLCFQIFCSKDLNAKLGEQLV